MSSRHFLFVIGAHVLRSKTAVGGNSPTSASISRMCALRSKVNTASQSRSRRISGGSFAASTQ